MKSSSGQTTIILLAGLGLIIFLATGIFTNAPPIFTGIKYVLVSVTPQPSQSTLQLQSLRFISILPTPTTIPSPNPLSTPLPTNNTQPTGTPSPTATPPVANPLLCGTNLGLFDDNDWVNNPGAQASLATLHVHTIRIPWRANTVDPTGSRMVK